MRTTLLIASGLILSAGAWPASACSIEPCRATVQKLVSEPSFFEGKRVIVEGVLDLRFEGHSIRHGKLTLALSLFTPNKDTGEFDEKQVAKDWARIEAWQRAGWQGRWVEVRGVFDPKVTGHFGMLKHGGIRNVEVIAEK